jgi:purine catabolism regulator
MALTVAQVASLPELSLLVRTAAAPLDRQVRWVAVSEHLDPTPWLEGGDLLLTTGMALTDDPTVMAPYVARLIGADVAAIGFGVGLSHQGVPGSLIAAAEEAGLPLVEVPQPVPFVAVGKAVSRLLSAEEYADSAASFEGQRRLIRAALADPSGRTDQVVSVLAKHVGGFTLHLDARGSVVAAHPATAAGRAGELSDEIDRLRPKGVLASSSVSTADEHLVIVPLGVKGPANGFLVVGADRPLRTADQAVMNVAVSLLSWEVSRPLALDTGMDAWRRLLFAAAMERGLTDDLVAEVGLADLHPRRGVGVVWRATGGRQVPDAVLAAVNAIPGTIAARRPSGDAVGFAPTGEDGHVVPDVRLSATAEGVAAAGVSCVLDLTLASNVRQALEQAERAAALGSGLQEFDEEPTRGLTSLIDAATTSAWAQGYLGDLLAISEGPELMNTLRAWLDQHGQVDAAAQQLGIHRHTVRHRVRRAEAVLGRPLDDPAVRADLWFALSAIGHRAQTAHGD